MRIHNTLTRRVEEIQTQTPGVATVYTCGPTVYDHAHVGHWFTYIRMDTLIRTLKSQGLKPRWVMNITDVGHLVSDADEGEDKLEKGARREGKTAWEVADSYTQDFKRGMELLHISKPEAMPKATDHIEEQIALIKQLEDKGYVYVIDDGVYFETSKFKHYADFAQLDLKDQQAGARVAVNNQKRHPQDFAVWKFSPSDAKRDMEWDSPWGKGFPGWHIECSAMSMKYLGETLDIHTGGIDHIPVHHTNEIAQSQAATGKPFAKYWMHANHVLVDGKKISKSLGNGISLDEIVKRGIQPEALRLLVLESHYSHQAHFSWDNLQAAQNRLNEFKALAALRWQALPTVNDAGTFALEDIPLEMSRIMAEDLNTPQALAFLSNASTQLQAVLIETDMLDHFEKMLKGVDALLGLNLWDVHDISAEQKDLIKAREAARAGQDWAQADKLRDELSAQGIGLRDTNQTVIWFPL